MSDFVEINEAWDKALRLAESLKSYILKKYENTDPKDREAGNKLMGQYDKACELERKAFSEVVKNSGDIKKYLESKRGTNKNKEGEMDTDWRRSSVDQMRVDLNRANDPNNERAIKNSIRKHKEKKRENDSNDGEQQT